MRHWHGSGRPAAFVQHMPLIGLDWTAYVPWMERALMTRGLGGAMWLR